MERERGREERGGGGPSSLRVCKQSESKPRTSEMLQSNLGKEMAVARTQQHINGPMLPHPGQQQGAIDHLFALHFKARVEPSLHRGQKLPFHLKEPSPADLSLSPPTPTHHLFFLIAPATSGNFTESQGSGSIFVLKTLKIELGRPDVS